MKKRIYDMCEPPQEAMDEKIEFDCPKCKHKLWFGVSFGGVVTLEPEDKASLRKTKIDEMKKKAISIVGGTCPNHAKEFEL